MVKYAFLIAVAFFGVGCEDQKDTFTSHKAFDSSRYEINNYSKRVKTFLKSRPETADLASYNAVFVNTKGCSACTRGAFSGISNFLAKTRTPVFIYANDSSLSTSVPDNAKVHFVCLKKEEYEKRDIFHNELYLYTVNNESFAATYLNLRKRDSLNSL